MDDATLTYVCYYFNLKFLLFQLVRDQWFEVDEKQDWVVNTGQSVIFGLYVVRPIWKVCLWRVAIEQVFSYWMIFSSWVNMDNICI